MWTPQYDIIVETLTGSEFEVTVTDKDTVGYIKSRIQIYEGIPVGQQHLLHNHKELNDATEMKDIPLGTGSRLKLVLDMKGGPVSARRVLNLPDYDNWFNLTDVLSTNRNDPLTISTPGVKLLVYKDCKKNIHRIMKLRSDRKNAAGQNKNNSNDTSASLNVDGQEDQWVKDNLQTIQKMHQLRTKLELKKKNKGKGNTSINNSKNQTTSTPRNLNENLKNERMENLFLDSSDEMNRMNHRNDRLDALSSNFKTSALEIDISSQSASGAIKHKTADIHHNGFGALPKYLNSEKQFSNSKNSNNNNACDYNNMLQVNGGNSKRSRGAASSAGLLNKYGLNKTFIRTPSLIPQQKQQQQNNHQKKMNEYFQLNNLSPMSSPRSPSPPKSYNSSLNILSSPDLPTERNLTGSKLHSTQSPNQTNVSKNSFSNFAINRPKCKPVIANKNMQNFSDETRSQLRENIRRNRSFKTINSNTNDMGNDECINLRPYAAHASLSPLDQFLITACKKKVTKASGSKSVQDLIEKLSNTRIGKQYGTDMGDSLHDLSKTYREFDEEHEHYLPRRISSAANHASGFENKLFIERQQTLSFDANYSGGIVGGEAVGGCAATDFSLENPSTATTNSALDHGGSFRLYKMSTDAGKTMSYELPKLLIREDSPVESFHSSDPQLETLTLRSESPKTIVDAYPNASTSEGDRRCRETTKDRDEKMAKTIIKSPWNHHHSDLGLNNLELNFLNEEYNEIDVDRSTDNCLQSGSVLKIASDFDLNNSDAWRNSSELDGKSQPSMTSLNFINGDLNSSDDEEDAFNGSCCMLHGNTKSKSVELNEFRMMFGSSPTLLNTNYNSTAHTSRLDAVPIQYRRGYSNLTDACLSSSTSDLELFNGGRKKNSSKSASQELPSPFSRHRPNNGSLDFVRSYENLDRMKILRINRDRERSRNLMSSGNGLNNGSGGGCTDGNGGKQFWDTFAEGIVTGLWKRRQSNRHFISFSRERLQEDEFSGAGGIGGVNHPSDEDFSYSNPGYENLVNSNNNDCSNKTECRLPLGFPSEESLFDMNLDPLNEGFNLLSSTALNDRLSSAASSNSSSSSGSRSSLLMPAGFQNLEGFATVKKVKNPKTNQNDRSSLLEEKQNHINKSVEPLVVRNAVVRKAEEAKRESPKVKLRCAKCNKKLGVIMIMKCHCEKIFCPQHRYAEAHNCSYNFKSEGKKILAKENPLVIAQKLPKI